MTDRELLKMAAKAAGYKPDGSFGTGLLVVINAGLTTQKAFPFDPLTDDGDALRLAVKLGLSVSISKECDWYDTFTKIDEGNIVEWHFGNPEAATRRAIVRAAAEIGKDMP